MGFFPERSHELDRLECLLGVEVDSLAVSLDLATAPGPQIGIGERRRIADRVTERLSERIPRGLQLLAGFAILVPGFRKLGDTNLVETGFAVSHHGADDAIGYSNPFLAIMG